MMNDPTAANSTHIASVILARLPNGTANWPAAWPKLFMLARIAIMLATYVVVERAMVRASWLDTDAYAAPSILLELLQRAGPVGCAILAIAALIGWRFGALKSAWHELEFGSTLRWFVTVLALAIAWPLTTFGYNYYFDQAYTLDRIVLGVLVALIWLRPVFIYPFLLLAFAMLWQLGRPELGGSIYEHKLQILHVLNLFAAALALHVITGTRRTQDFWFLACCLVAGSYWVAAVAKLELGWLSHAGLHFILPASYAHGWLGNLAPDTIVTIVKAIAPFDLVMRVVVLVVECGCLLFLWRRWCSLTLLAGVIGFHIGVFALYGFLFWTWMAVDALLLAALLSEGLKQRLNIYTPTHLLASIVLIVSALWWGAPPELGWLDTRLAYTYKVDAIDSEGKRYTLSPKYFAPYEDVFTMASFKYLLQEPRIKIGPYGVTKIPTVADRLASARSASDVYDLESKHGVSRYNPARVERFKSLIAQYVATKSDRGSVPEVPRWLRSPPQFWSLRKGETAATSRRISEVIVTELTSFYDGTEVKTIRALEVLRIAIPPAAVGS